MPLARYRLTHNCTLEDTSSNYLPPLPPNAVFHEKCSRSFRKIFLINETNRRCHEFFRSRHSIFKEKQRQVQDANYRCIIHPFSKFSKFREVAMCFVWLILLLFEPFIASFYLHRIHHVTRWRLSEFVVSYVQVALNFVTLLDVVVNFSMGYVVRATGFVVLERSSIAKRYVKTFFICDVLACFPTIFFLFGEPGNFLVTDLVAQMLYFRLARTVSLVEYLNSILILHVKESAATCVVFSLMTFLVVHWFSCVLRLIPSILLHETYINSLTKRRLSSSDHQYLETLRVTTCHFFGAGTGYTKNYHTIELLVLSLITVAGKCFFPYLISRVIQLFGVVNIDESKYEEIINQLNQYVNVKKIPKDLSKRIKLYHNYKFQGKFFDESRILATLSTPLRCEVKFYCCRGLIERVPLFVNLPKAVVGSILGLVQSEVYLPDDVIHGFDEDGKYVCFIASGTVAGYLEDGSEIIHLDDGQEFGEVCAVLARMGQKCFVRYRAVEITEVFTISRKNMQYCLRFHPEVGELLEKLGTKRLEAYKKLRDKIGEDSEPTSIAQELRRKRILEARRRRNSK